MPPHAKLQASPLNWNVGLGPVRRRRRADLSIPSFSWFLSIAHGNGSQVLAYMRRERRQKEAQVPWWLEPIRLCFLTATTIADPRRWCHTHGHQEGGARDLKPEPRSPSPLA
jgi:hypothetical protein